MSEVAPETRQPYNASSKTQLASRLKLYLTLFLFLVAVYLLTYTPHINSSDGLAMFATAENMVRRGALDIEQIRWMGRQQGSYGLDGLLYSRKGIGLPIGLLPLTWLGLIIPWLGPVSVSLLFNTIVTALTAVLLLAYLQLLGFSQRIGLIVALTFGLTTLAWPYAKSLFSDPFSGLLLLAAALMLLKYRHRLADRKHDVKEEIDSYPLPLLLRYPIRFRWYFVGYLHYPFLAGLFLGWNVATRYAELLFVPVFGLLLLYYLGFGRTHPILFWVRYPAPNPWPPIIAFITPIVLIGLGLITFNITRYGDPFNTGYLPQETFSAVLWQGVLGQLISPGRGLLLYCPIFILSFFGLSPALRHFRAETLLAVSIILIHLLLYGKWFMWHGGFAWGPRFMIPTLAFWAVFLGPVAARAFPDKKRSADHRGLGLRIAYLSLAILGLIPQFLSVTIDFAPFQTVLLDTGLPLFAPQTFFDPQYSPLIRAWELFATETLDLAWAWQDQFTGWLLAILLINIVITGFYLMRSANTLTGTGQQIPLWAQVGKSASANTPDAAKGTQAPRPTLYVLRAIWLPLLSTLIALLSLLLYAHSLPSSPLEQAVTALNQNIRPTDGVIINDPEVTIPFAELYKGRAPVLGLNNGGFPLPDDISRRLSETTDQHEQVWWLPNWLPPEESAIEQTLLATGFQARNDSHAGQRLGLFAFPANLAAQTVPVKATFGEFIVLNQVAYPQIVSPGTALPIELRWHATAPVTEDFHVFIHVMTQDGQILAQADGQPVHWTRPTTSWEAGEIIVDRYGLWLPAEVRPGDYQLFIGLYRPADGQRLYLPDGQDSVQLKVTVL